MRGKPKIAVKSSVCSHDTKLGIGGTGSKAFRREIALEKNQHGQSIPKNCCQWHHSRWQGQGCVTGQDIFLRFQPVGSNYNERLVLECFGNLPFIWQQLDRKKTGVSRYLRTGSPRSEPTNCCERTFAIHRNELSGCSEPGSISPTPGEYTYMPIIAPPKKKVAMGVKDVEIRLNDISQWPFWRHDQCIGDAADREALPDMLHLVPNGYTTAGSGLHLHFHLLLLWLDKDNRPLGVGKILSVFLIPMFKPSPWNMVWVIIESLPH